MISVSTRVFANFSHGTIDTALPFFSAGQAKEAAAWEARVTTQHFNITYIVHMRTYCDGENNI
jgi:hypothetical protein